MAGSTPSAAVAEDIAAGAGYPPQTYAWYVVSILCIGYIFAFIDRIVVGLLTTAIQKDLLLTDTQMGVLQGIAFALFYVLFGIPIGWLVDRWHRKTILTFGMTVWSLATAACGYAGTFWTFFLCRVGVGIGEATLNPCSASIIGDYFPPKQRPKAFGIYVMGTAFGTGLTYLGGGVVFGFLAAYTVVDLGLFGELKPWRAMFLFVGLAGLLPALIFLLTVKEPARKDLAAKQKGNASWDEIKAFFKLNRRAIICHHIGISMVIMSIYAWVNWMAVYFDRIHQWGPAKFAITYGVPGLITGIISALSCGWLATKLKERGTIDGTMRAALIGCIGVVAGGVIAPQMPTPELALAAFVVTGLFSNYPSVLALAAISEITPNEMRGFLTSTYIFLVGLISSGVGPLLTGWVTDNVFGDQMRIADSLSLVTIITGSIGCATIAFGLKGYRESLARVTWGK
ncbi:MAG: MFS transporter [Rhodospirillaceae bacterium]|nr:MFS transporter [Rhodospirillaceae bacterium]